jgi:hypothetical protein
MIKSLNKALAKIEQLSELEQEKLAQIILKELESLTSSPSGEKEVKLSEILLLPELEDDEVLFQRDQDTGRIINIDSFHRLKFSILGIFP